jgi:hypothetical protein
LPYDVVPRARATPKSATRMLPSAAISTLSGFRSLRTLVSVYWILIV